MYLIDKFCFPKKKQFGPQLCISGKEMSKCIIFEVFIRKNAYSYFPRYLFNLSINCFLFSMNDTKKCAKIVFNLKQVICDFMRILANNVLFFHSLENLVEFGVNQRNFSENGKTWRINI